MQPAVDRLRQLAIEAQSRYARLVLVVGAHGTGKTRLLRGFAAAEGLPILELGADLPPALFDIPSRKRPVTVVDVLGDMLRSAADVAVVDNIEVLFDPQLRIDPLKLFQDHARNRVIIAAWPGGIDGDVLTFAVAGHPEFRTYSSPDAVLFAIAQHQDR